MKTFKKLSISLVLLLMILPTYVASQDRIDENDIKDMVNRNVVPTFQKTEVSGSPYVSEDFTEGSFELYSGSYASGLNMNYNLYEEGIEYIAGSETYAVDPANIRQFILKIDGEKRTFKRGFESRRLEGDKFVEVAAEGPVNFLIKHEVSFNENVSSGYGSATKQASYSKNERYYFQKGDEVSNIRRLNNRRVMRYLDGNKEVEKFIDQNDLDMSDPYDVAVAVRKFNKSVTQ
ncbi:MAG: hypothetical protein U5K71_12535 [Gracilimonas sp.]|nr:hypothetical protein [Gracilimonas sp.]